MQPVHRGGCGNPVAVEPTGTELKIQLVALHSVWKADIDKRLTGGVIQFKDEGYIYLTIYIGKRNIIVIFMMKSV